MRKGSLPRTSSSLRPDPTTRTARAATAARSLSSRAGVHGCGDLLPARGIEALDQQRGAGAKIDRTTAGRLVSEHANRQVTRGELDRAQRLFEEAAQFASDAGNEVSAAIARGQISDILQSRGDLDAALRIHREEALPVYERLGGEHARVVTMGKIADILQIRGELDEALRIRRDEQLPVYGPLGDVHSRAVTMGKIADILQRRGELEEARSVHEECLQAARQLSAIDGIAATLWAFAQLDLNEGNFDEAAPRIAEAYDIFFRLGRAEGIAVVGLTFGQLLAAAEDTEAALSLLRRSVEMFRKLGQEASAQETEKIIQQLGLDSSAP